MRVRSTLLLVVISLLAGVNVSLAFDLPRVLQPLPGEVWLKRGETADDVFILLKLDRTGELFSNSQFATWIKYVDDLSASHPAREKTTISKLTSYFGDEPLSNMIIAAQRNPETQVLATDLQTRQLQYWLDNKKAPADVFKLLELSKAGDKLLENPLATAWLSYATNFKEKTMSKVDESIPILTTHYGDEALSTILIRAMKTPSTANVAGKLHNEQIQLWLDAGKRPRDVFKFLALDKAGDKLLENPQFATWLTYLDDFNSKNTRISRIAVMTNYFGDDKLTAMLFDAMRSPSTAKLAANLQDEQIKRWLYTEKSPRDVFQFLSLSKAGEKLFDHPQFMKWVSYVDDLNTANPDKRTSLMSVLAAHYDSDGLIKMLESAKNVPGSAKLIRELETEQKWLAKGTPDAFFKQLKLDKFDDDVLSNPQLKTWINYMKEYNAANPKYKATLIGTMAANYGELNLVSLLDKATHVKDTAGAAKKLQSELFQRWMQKGWTPEYLFTNVFHLAQEKDELFTNPLVITWGKYLSAYNRENHGKETTIWTMLAATGVDIELVERMVGQLPSDTFSMLRLAEKGDDLLASPQFATWIQYLDDFYLTFPDLRRTMMKTVRRHHDDKSLVKMIISGMKVSSTEKIAKRMERELLKDWNVSRKTRTPDEIFEGLDLELAGKTLFASPFLEIWIQYMATYYKQKPDMIRTFLKYYDEDELFQMIKTAKSNPTTEKLASDVEHALSLYKKN
ncbi:hypothetical protein GN958_ATG13681 [Phytophthora infestans]|uniref:RxLR effector PexRD54 WY domain-containing protein n=1 Tax=Phytophthora infestans TaxID=4787 RepID=A0A8S9UC73_PHYIN|nr:hypothetical protein GN958_ATG13681 [Phytophthora infestans]